MKKLLTVAIITFLISCESTKLKETAPNILICIADDAGHMGKKYNDPLMPVFENRDNNERVRDMLFELYPDLNVRKIYLKYVINEKE